MKAPEKKPQKSFGAYLKKHKTQTKKMETKNITQAILNVMSDVKSIEKTMNVGTGANSYKGVPDEAVKKAVGESMQANGLVLVPISIEPTTKIDRWEETTQYGTRQKQSIFTEVKTKYLLMHTSGESIEIQGYGHGVDTQDKGAGKATTYALKYALLYTFLIPTTKIDDSDKDHSDEYDISPKPVKKDTRAWLNKDTEEWTAAIKYLNGGGSITNIEKKYRINKANREELLTVSV